MSRNLGSARSPSRTRSRHASLALGASCALAASLTFTAPARAGGFYVPEQGARSVGMAGASVAAPSEASGIFHNPASITGGPTLDAELDALVVLPRFTFYRRPATDPYPQTPAGATVDFAPVKNTNHVAVVPFMGITSNLGVEDLGVGLGVYVPFGADLAFPTDGAQRNVVTKISLRAIHVTPTVAYRFWKRLSVGVGLSYIRSSFILEQRNASPFVLGIPNDFPNPQASTEGDTKIDATDSAALGANLGVLYTDPEDRFSLGASVMAPTRLDFRGTVDVTNRPESIVEMPDAQGNLLPAGRRTDSVALSIPLPMILRAGARVRPARQVAVELDVNYQRWSTTREQKIVFEHNYPLLPQPGAQMNDIVLDQSYRDTMTVRLGAELAPLYESPLRVRAGVVFDQSPIDDRHFDLLTPDSDKLGVSLGGGYAVPLGPRATLGIDLSYMHLFFAERNVGPRTIGTDATGKVEVPGSDRTILNKPAPSFFYGVTRAAADLLSIGVSLRI